MIDEGLVGSRGLFGSELVDSQEDRGLDLSEVALSHQCQECGEGFARVRELYLHAREEHKRTVVQVPVMVLWLVPLEEAT